MFTEDYQVRPFAYTRTLMEIELDLLTYEAAAILLKMYQI